MPHEKRNDDTLKVLIALEGRDPEVVTDFAELERRVAAALADPIRFKDHLSVLVDPLPPRYSRLDVETSMRMLREHAKAFPVVADWADRTRAMKSTYDALYLPYQREALKQRRFMETYGAGVGKIREAIAPPLGFTVKTGKTSDFLSSFTVDVPLYSITVSEAMIDAAERVLRTHVLLAYRRRALLVESFIDAVRPSFAPPSAEWFGPVVGRLGASYTSLTGRPPRAPEPQFLGAGRPRNPRKPGG